MQSYRTEDRYLGKTMALWMDEEQSFNSSLKTKRHRQKLRRRLTAFGIISVTILCGMIFQQVTLESTLENKLKEKERLENQLKAMKKEGAGLETEIVRLQDPDYIAKIAR